MKCLSPIAIKGHVSAFVSEGRKFQFEHVYVPCGQCIACRLNYAKFWSIRMMQELRKYDSACFATLTYDDEHLPDDHLLHKEDLQNFWKRLRKERNVRYFCCGEYGDQFGRPHYHAIIYNVSPQETDLILKHWQNGNVKLGTVTEDSCNYVAKYMTKKLRGKALQQKLEEDPEYQNEFVLMSRRPGIGGDLDSDMVKFIKENGFVYRKGFKSALPRYYKDKYDVETNLCEVQDFEEFRKHLQNLEKNDRLIRKGMEFFKGNKNA